MNDIQIGTLSVCTMTIILIMAIYHSGGCFETLNDCLKVIFYFFTTAIAIYYLGYEQSFISKLIYMILAVVSSVEVTANILKIIFKIQN